MLVNQFLLLAAVLFCIGVYGVIARKNAVLVLMSIELILLAVNINLVAFSAFLQNLEGQIFAMMVLTVAAAEAAVGLVQHGHLSGPRKIEEVRAVRSRSCARPSRARASASWRTRSNGIIVTLPPSCSTRL